MPKEGAELVGKWTGDSYRNCIGKLNHFNCEGDCVWNFILGFLLAV